MSLCIVVLFVNMCVCHFYNKLTYLHRIYKIVTIFRKSKTIRSKSVYNIYRVFVRIFWVRKFCSRKKIGVMLIHVP